MVSIGCWQANLLPFALDDLLLPRFGLPLPRPLMSLFSIHAWCFLAAFGQPYYLLFVVLNHGLLRTALGGKRPLCCWFGAA